MYPPWRTLRLHDRDGVVVVLRWPGDGAYWPGPADPSPYAVCSCLRTVDLRTGQPRAARIAVWSSPMDALAAWQRIQGRSEAGFPWPTSWRVDLVGLRSIDDWSSVPEH